MRAIVLGLGLVGDTAVAGEDEVQMWYATQGVCSCGEVGAGLYCDSQSLRTSAFPFSIQSARDSHSLSKYLNFIWGFKAMAAKCAGTRSLRV